MAKGSCLSIRDQIKAKAGLFIPVMSVSVEETTVLQWASNEY